TYRALYRLERDTNTGDDHHQVWVVWFNGGTEVSRHFLVGHPGAPLYDEGSVTDAAFTAPAGVTHVRLLFTRDIAPVTTRVSDIAVFEASEGNITVSGDVRGSAGVFTTLALVDPVTVGGRQFLRVSGWQPLDLLADWTATHPARRRRSDDQVFLTGEIICTNSSAGSSRPITILPDGWRPPHRIRLPWGWGDTLTSITIEPDGTVWSLSGVRTSPSGMHLNAVRF